MFFKNITTLEELKSEYRKLAMIHHPDRGGKTNDFQDLQNEYEKLFEEVKDFHRKKNGDMYTKETVKETPDMFRDIINNLMTIKGIKIEVIGCFIWITGVRKSEKTKQEKLKAMGFRYSREKNKWSWHSPDYKKRSHTTHSMEWIRESFGVQWSGETEKQLELTV